MSDFSDIVPTPVPSPVPSQTVHHNPAADHAISALDTIAQKCVDSIRCLPNPYADTTNGICALKEIGIAAVQGIADIGAPWYWGGKEKMEKMEKISDDADAEGAGKTE